MEWGEGGEDKEQGGGGEDKEQGGGGQRERKESLHGSKENMEALDAI